jgi:hypothetical protein
MITSITSATLVATSAVVGWGATLGAGGAILVIALLALREMLGATVSDAGGSLTRLLRVATGPLLMVFCVSVAARVAAVLAGS